MNSAHTLRMQNLNLVRKCFLWQEFNFDPTGDYADFPKFGHIYLIAGIFRGGGGKSFVFFVVD